MKCDFFISYTQADSRWAEWIAWQLEAKGYRCRIQAWDYRPGMNFMKLMRQDAKEAERILAVLSPEALESKFAGEEQDAGLTHDKIVPVLVREADLDPILGNRIYIPLVGLNENAARRRLLKGIRKGRAKPEAKPAFPGSPSAFPEDSVEPVFPGALPPHWNLPRRNLAFTGRDDLLEKLKKRLRLGAPSVLTQAVRGMGGVGKTELALEYAYRRKDLYRIVWWVRSEEKAALVEDLAQLQAEMVGGQAQGEKRPAAMQAVRALERREGWLLVFDNALGPQAVHEFLPRAGGGHVLLTSRHSRWKGTAEELQVDVFLPETSVEFLQDELADEAEAACLELAETLGRLPLALAQARAYIAETKISIEDYLTRFRASRTKLWDAEEAVDSYGQTVSATLSLALERVIGQAPEAIQILNLCAFLDPEEIPRNLLEKVLPDPLARDNALKILARYSLIRLEQDWLSIHRLVQAVVRDRLKEDRGEIVTQALSLVEEEFDFKQYEVESWKVTAQLLPHALATANHADSLQVQTAELSRLLNDCGGYQRFVMADFQASRRSRERALEIARAVYGEEHPVVATRLNNLALVLQDQGDLAGAREGFERALEIARAVYGEEHPEVATRLNNLASVLQDQGDLAGAREGFERALEIDRAVYGEEHPVVVTGLNNLAGVLRAQGDLAGAREGLERALEICLRFLDEEHPRVKSVRNSLRQLSHSADA